VINGFTTGWVEGVGVGVGVGETAVTCWTIVPLTAAAVAQPE
jgi:hypothetical protein